MSSPYEAPSWLALERYALEELAGSERTAIDSALAHDATAQECLRRIRADRRELPPLPVVHAPKQRFSFAAIWAFATMGVAVTAALLLVRGEPDDTNNHNAALPGAKGDALALSLVRESGGSLAIEPTLFDTTDRFKIQVTCGRAGMSHVDIVVYQDGEATFPLDAQRIACGNNVVLDGAFRLDRMSEAEVCVVLTSEAAVRRDRLMRERPGPESSACSRLTPAR